MHVMSKQASKPLVDVPVHKWRCNLPTCLPCEEDNEEFANMNSHEQHIRLKLEYIDELKARGMYRQSVLKFLVPIEFQNKKNE